MGFCGFKPAEMGAFPDPLPLVGNRNPAAQAVSPGMLVVRVLGRGGGLASGRGCGQCGRPGRRAGQGHGAAQSLQGREESGPVGSASGWNGLFAEGVNGGTGNGGEGLMPAAAFWFCRRPF